MLKKHHKGKNWKNVPHLEYTEVVVLVHCNISNEYLQDARVLFNFVYKKIIETINKYLTTKFNILKTLMQKFRILRIGYYIKIANFFKSKIR